MRYLARSLAFAAPGARSCALATGPARWLVGLLAAVGLAMAPAAAHAAGGSFIVDDAEIAKPGTCKVESWLATASNHDMLAITQPACVVNLGIPTELTAAAARVHSGDVWQTQVGGKVKINILPAEIGKVGVSLAGSAGWDAGNGEYLFNLLYVPFTFQLREDFRINLNAGWQYDAVGKLSYALWGTAFEWNFVKPLTLIGEVFGLAGPASDPSTITTPRAQLGLRITPVDNIDLDLIYGHNITGENAHWLTIGVSLRF
jgi:hypothetical protein